MLLELPLHVGRESCHSRPITNLRTMPIIVKAMKRTMYLLIAFIYFRFIYFIYIFQKYILTFIKK